MAHRNHAQPGVREDLRALLPYATETQRKVVEAIEEAGSNRKAAKLLGVTLSSVTGPLRRLRQQAARFGMDPDADAVHPVPHGQKLRGLSTLYKADGSVALQWVKSAEDREKQLEILQEAVQGIVEELPEVECSPGPENPETDVIPWINIGDAHIGMLAHEAETGANFDLKIAERELCAAISMLIEETGEHQRCVINDLGDFTHYENMAGVTDSSGHPLDFDGRFPKMIRVYGRIMRYIVERAMEKFQYVDVIINQGNHSRTNDIWMADFVRALYGHTGRVNALNNDSVFIAYRMGKTLVMTHHSDKCKPEQLANVMATDFRADWGECDYCYIDIGHIHHKMTSKEHPGVMIESFNILANADKYAHDKGYRSRQSITVVDRSRKYGEVGRRVLPIQKVRDSIRANCAGDEPYEPKPKMAYAV